jgi:hypothetical protein
MLSVQVRGPSFEQFRRAENERAAKILKVAHIVSERAARETKDEIRKQMAGAGLGRLGNAITHTSDLQMGRRFKSRGGNDFSVSGVVYIRRSGERTRGAVDAYTSLSSVTISPRNSSGLLWFPTDDIQRLVGRGKGRKRLEAKDWARSGMAARLGPLEPITAKDGTQLLIVKNVGLSASGKAGSAKSLTKRGRARKGQVAVDFVVAFVGIPQTSRKRRVDVIAIAKRKQAQMGAFTAEAFREVGL